jgi:hypothetical protein
MSSKPVTFTATDETQAILATVEKGKASRFINEAIRFYKVYGVNHDRSSIVDLNDLFQQLIKLRNPTHFESEMTATLTRLMPRIERPRAVPEPTNYRSPMINFAPPEPAPDRHETPLWTLAGYDSEDEMNRAMDEAVARGIE